MYLLLPIVQIKLSILNKILFLSRQMTPFIFVSELTSDSVLYDFRLYITILNLRFE